MQLRNIYCVLWPLMMTHNAFSSDFSLPKDLYPRIIVYALDNNITFVPVLKRVSKQFYEIIDKPETLKTIIAHNLGQSPCSTTCANAINTPGSLKYKKINEQLMHEWDIDTYFEKFKKDPYADINCIDIYRYAFRSKLSVVYFDNCIPLEEKNQWIGKLINNGANPHLVFHGDQNQTHTVVTELNGTLLVGHVYEHDKRHNLDTLEIFLKHNAQANEKYIELKHLSIDRALKQEPEDFNRNERPFMARCIDYLKLISKYGFDIKTVYPNPLHYHLHKNPHPAPVMVHYLVHELHCNPFEPIADAGDGSESECPYYIINNFPDEVIKHEMLANL